MRLHAQPEIDSKISLELVEIRVSSPGRNAAGRARRPRLLAHNLPRPHCNFFASGTSYTEGKD